HLCLEITETAAFKDATRTMDILSRTRLKGVQLSIDDFGTGYSSLKLLRQMPFTEIKIDQSFIKDLTTSEDARVIVKAIIDLAANMKMGCVAEGVESDEAAELLEQLGACHLQGYLIAKPMPVEAIAGWLTIWTQSDPATSRGESADLVEESLLALSQAAPSRTVLVQLPAEPCGGISRLSP